MGLAFYPDMILLSFFLLAIGLGDSFVLMACIQPLEPSWRQATPFALSGLASKVRSRFWWIRSAESEGVLPINRGGRARGDDDDDDGESGRGRSFDTDAESIEGAVSVGVAAGGPFITVLNMALSTSLVIGAYTAIPAFRSFCITACVCVVFLWVFQFTFFLPCLALDAQRQNARRCDAPFCCCPPVAPYALEHKLCTANETFDETSEATTNSGRARVHPAARACTWRHDHQNCANSDASVNLLCNVSFILVHLCAVTAPCADHGSVRAA